MRQVNPQFAAWFDKLPKQAQAQLEAKREALETDPAIAHQHRHADYAKRRMLLRAAKKDHGFR